jgi:hypothetical protein
MNATTELPYDIANAAPAVQERYLEQIAMGAAPRMAEMIALRKAPRVMTDSVFFEGRGTLDKQFEGTPCGQLDELINAAKAAGYTPNPNDVYEPGLAEFFGDPKAFVPPTGGMGHVQRVCEERGVGCQGAINLKGRAPEKEPEHCRLAPDLVQEQVAAMVAANPELRYTADPRELAEEVVSKHGFDDSLRAGETSRQITDLPSE